jgi:hypothetical protein
MHQWHPLGTGKQISHLQSHLCSRMQSTSCELSNWTPGYVIDLLLQRERLMLQLIKALVDMSQCSLKSIPSLTLLKVLALRLYQCTWRTVCLKIRGMHVLGEERKAGPEIFLFIKTQSLTMSESAQVDVSF